MKINTQPNRWLVVLGAILIQLALGALYAWSVFTRILTDPEGIYQFTATQTAWIFSAGLATFAAVMILAGRWLARVGPRRLTILGGLFLGLGFVLGGFFGTSFWAQFLCIGLIAGAGIVVRNSIILVDYINVLRRRGESLETALRTAAETRLTPIVLTALTTIGGLLPLTLRGGSMWAPMGWTIIGGLLVSTLLPLIIVPVGYKLLERGKSTSREDDLTV